MQPEALQEPFDLTQGTTGVVGTNTAANVLEDLWVYTVPVGVGHIILPGHTISIFMQDLGAAESAPDSMVKILIRDAMSQDEKTIYGPTLYQTVKDFQDRDLMARFNIKESVKLYEGQQLVIQANDVASGVDVTGGASESYFDLAISRVRQPL